MTLLPTQVRRPHPPLCGKLQAMALRGLSGRESEKTLQIWKVNADRGNSPVYVNHWGYATVIGVDHPSIDTQGKHIHLGGRPPGDTLKGCGGHYRYPPPGQNQFHDVLHGFHAGRGTAMAAMEIKLSQDLSRVNQYPLFLVLLDMSKAYNTVDHDRLIRVLEGYGVGPQMCELLVTFWAHQEVVRRHNGYHIPNFIAA